MDISLKHIAILAAIAVVSGLLAGVLAATVDLSWLEYYFPVIYAILIAVNIGLIALAIKKGRIS